MIEAPGRVRSAVLVTASEPEPRAFGKQVVIGGLLDHLCARLGPENVHVVIVGRSSSSRPSTPYHVHVLSKPSAGEQVRAALTRVVRPPYSSLQEAALWSPRLLKEIRSVTEKIGADLEIWDTMRTGQYARALPRRRRVLYADDLFSKRYASMLDRLRDDPSRFANPLGEFQTMLPSSVGRLASKPAVYTPLLHLEQRLTARSEDAAPHLFDATILVNPDETAELTQRSGNGSVHCLLPLLREPGVPHRHFDGSPTFVFLGGMSFPPNRDGLSWFLTSCREELLARLPDFRLLLVGRGSEEPLPEAAEWGDHVQPLGWVDSLDGVLGSAAALISPLRIGSGMKIKVLEALARGLPVAATERGVLGLGVGEPDGCLVGRTPHELVDQLVRCVDLETNQSLSVAARTSWETRFSPAVVSRHYDRVLGLGTQDDASPG